MRAIFKDNRIFIYDSFIHKESIKQITGRLWRPNDKAWSVPITAESLETLDLLGCEFSDELCTMKQRYECEPSQKIQALISAPLKVTPYEHQLKAYNYAGRSMGIIAEKIVSPDFVSA